MRGWRRALRLASQSRIRIPSAPVRAEEIDVGCRIQLCTRLFRVRSRTQESDRTVFELESLSASEGAVLTSPEHGGDRWSYLEGTTVIPVPAELLVVYQVV